MGIMVDAALRKSGKKSTPIVTANFVSRATPGPAEIVVEEISHSPQFQRFQTRLFQEGEEKVRAWRPFRQIRRTAPKNVTKPIRHHSRYPKRVKTVAISSTLCYSKDTIPRLNRVDFPKPFDELEPALRKKLMEWHVADHAESFFNQFRDRGGSYGTGMFDIRPLLPSVDCPTLVLYPDRSRLFEVEQGVAFYRHLPKGELAVLPRCGHNTYEQQPMEYVHVLLGFLKRHMSMI